MTAAATPRTPCDLLIRNGRIVTMNRARDLLTDDYESGDAAWITGRFRNLNAQIGSYETYDDELMGTRAF